MTQLISDQIVDTLATYQARHGVPSGAAEILNRALATRQQVTSRHDYPVHVTCGVIAVRPDGRVLQVHHRVLDRWLSPAVTSSKPGRAESLATLGNHKRTLRG